MSKLTKSMTSFIDEITTRFNIKDKEELITLWKQIVKNNKKKTVKTKPEENIPDSNLYIVMLENSLTMDEEEFLSLRDKEHDKTGFWYPHIKEEEDIFTFLFGTYGREFIEKLDETHSLVQDHREAYENWMETFYNPQFKSKNTKSDSKKKEKSEVKTNSKKKSDEKKKNTTKKDLEDDMIKDITEYLKEKKYKPRDISFFLEDNKKGIKKAAENMYEDYKNKMDELNKREKDWVRGYLVEFVELPDDEFDENDENEEMESEYEEDEE